MCFDNRNKKWYDTLKNNGAEAASKGDMMTQDIEVKKEHKAGKIVLRVLLILGILLVLLLSFLVFSYFHLKSFYTTPRKEDDRGRLYYMEYTGDYDSPFVTFLFDKLKPVRDGGCSAFYTASTDGGYRTGRNYDLAHKDKNGNTTGLNLVIRCNPKGRYRSVALADIAMLSRIGLDYAEGSLDEGKLTDVLLALSPYICVDGINEKGLSVSVLALDLKEGETAVFQTDEGKDSDIITGLLRQILDNCASVDEAVELAENRNLINTFGADYHMFVTDDSGKSAVLEWRNNTLVVTYTDIVTNFYVAFDDAEDCYRNGALKEAYIPPESNPGNYRFGYGHGYERFKKIMSYKAENAPDGTLTMSNDEIKELLHSVTQEYTGELTSLTQYSAIYDNTDRCVDIYVNPDYSTVYHYDVE